MQGRPYLTACWVGSEWGWEVQVNVLVLEVLKGGERRCYTELSLRGPVLILILTLTFGLPRLALWPPEEVPLLEGGAERVLAVVSCFVAVQAFEV